MIELGRVQELMVVREKNFGVYLGQKKDDAAAVLLQERVNFSSLLPVPRKSMPYFLAEAVLSVWMQPVESCSFWKKKGLVLMSV